MLSFKSWTNPINLFRLKIYSIGTLKKKRVKSCNHIVPKQKNLPKLRGFMTVILQLKKYRRRNSPRLRSVLASRPSLQQINSTIWDIKKASHHREAFQCTGGET